MIVFDDIEEFSLSELGDEYELRVSFEGIEK